MAFTLSPSRCMAHAAQVIGTGVALGPEDEPPMRIGPHLQTKGFINSKRGPVREIQIDLDTGAEVSCVSHEWAQTQNLKPYTHNYPGTLGVVGNVNITAKGAYWICFALRDSAGKTRQFYRPFLAVDREPEEAPILINNAELQQMGVHIRLLPGQGCDWNFAPNHDIPYVQEESAHRFRKRLLKIPKSTHWFQ
ncbi:hypothetical protein V1520DRAFT_117810 [Lipomyces starkeyi]|uniref:Peptidase A2 domain-containing protein n=1 Tax=Lipomyces starkeyi NRRL Y-11557 TaxID=675824 RepID=A0A1E3PTF3_LIPST|nr:hypothetical protein LIPSTDRAFT_338482 [Lipomyces starkeyi NRRL Y-11557]